MSKPYFYKWNPRDWLCDMRVRELSLEARGAYIDILSLMWVEQKATITVSHSTAILSGSRAEHGNKWKRIRRELANVLEVNGDNFTSIRVEKELAEFRATQAKRKIAAQKRWAKNDASAYKRKNNMQCNIDIESDIDIEKEIDYPPTPHGGNDGDGVSGIELIPESVEQVGLDLSALGGQERAVMTAIDGWMKSQGYLAAVQGAFAHGVDPGDAAAFVARWVRLARQGAEREFDPTPAAFARRLKGFARHWAGLSDDERQLERDAAKQARAADIKGKRHREAEAKRLAEVAARNRAALAESGGGLPGDGEWATFEYSPPHGVLNSGTPPRGERDGSPP